MSKSRSSACKVANVRWTELKPVASKWRVPKEEDDCEVGSRKGRILERGGKKHRGPPKSVIGATELVDGTCRERDRGEPKVRNSEVSSAYRCHWQCFAAPCLCAWAGMMRRSALSPHAIGPGICRFYCFFSRGLHGQEKIEGHDQALLIGLE